MHRSFVLLAISFLSCIAAPGQERATLNFNPGWLLQTGDPADASKPEFDDSKWKPVTLPHAWNEDEAFHVAIDQHPTGIAWYRKSFKLPPDAKGRKVFIEFEGVRQGAEIWLNGKSVGLHENGVMAFGLDLTEAVLPPPATNVIAVRTDNDWAYRERATKQRYQWSDKNFNANYGGIPKNVKLHIADKVYQTLPLYSNLGTTGTYIYAKDFNIAGRSAVIHAESEIRNESGTPFEFTFHVEMTDMDGKVVARFDGGRQAIAAGATLTAKASAPVNGLNFWSWGYGYLYKLETSLVSEGKKLDAVTTRTGFRKTEFGNGMVKLNDRVIQMHGYAQRTSNEWPAIGMSVPPWLSDFSNGLMVESGANLVRWMHTAPWKQDVESCDRVGLMQQMPAGDAEGDVTGRRWEQRVEAMRDVTIYNRNNPSVLVYEAGNKGVREEHMLEMKAIRDRYDPHGGRAAGSREMLASRTAEWGGEMLYINKSARTPFWSTEYSRDEALRKYWDNFSPPFHKDGDGPLHKGESAAIYNRNQDSFAVEAVTRWFDYWNERPGTGRRVNSGGLNIVFSDSNTHYRGAENYRRSGEVDAMRIPKDAFYAHKVMWDAWVDVEKPAAYIIGHWNYAPNVKKPVHVVSSAESVELFLNEQSLGKGNQDKRFLFTFPEIAWKPGTLRAVGFDGAGKKVCEATKATAGNPVALKLTPATAPGGLLADGADLALIQVEVMDAKGQRCPIAMDMVKFDLSGPAEWRGGIAQGPDNYILKTTLPVECGVNRVLVRSLTKPGEITLTATAGGLKPAKVELRSVPFETRDGWAETFAADSLPSRLDRGPTPSSPSFKSIRRDVPITAVSAGSNEESAKLSFDDDETTSWTSEGDLANSWIEYQLAKPADLAEAVFRLSGWRQRSYQMRIMVDGRETWKGATPTSLGYITLPLANAKGSKVRVEVLGEGSNRVSYTLTELADQKNVSTGDEKVRARALSIVEAEFYEAAP
jgi:beta-galactosidase